MAPPLGEITALLRRIEQGDAAAHEQLANLVRAQLKRIAANRLRHERPDHLYETSDLVQEAYLRLFKLKDIQWAGHAHFFRMAALQMRRILVEYARHHYRDNPVNLPLDDIPGLIFSREPDWLAVDEILYDLEKLDPARAELVVLRYFGGYQLGEIAQLTGLSYATVKRRWQAARALIKWRLDRNASSQASSQGEANGKLV
jgi:RNA polymerase sigma factor (TIGR02999 family)